MRLPPRLPSLVVVFLVFAAAMSRASNVALPRVSLQTTLGTVSGAAVLGPGLSLGHAALAPASMLPLNSMLFAPPAPVPALVPVRAAASVPSFSVASPAAARSAPLADLEGHGLAGAIRFDGAQGRSRHAVSLPEAQEAGPEGFVKNFDGVWVGGRVAQLALWINELRAGLPRTLDLSDVMNVMHETYDDVCAKLSSVEESLKELSLSRASVHLEGTRNWVDAVLRDKGGSSKGGSSIAVHTHSAYFHPNADNPDSEIQEAIGRLDSYLVKAQEDFAPGGRAEQNTGETFKQVRLYFNTRGYKEIEDHLRAKEQEFRKAYGGRFVFRYIDRPKLSSDGARAKLRAEYNKLVTRYSDQPEGLLSVVDGPTYSRLVGLAHELNSHKVRLGMGLTITQAGRDFFADTKLPDGRIIKLYRTEFDAITEPSTDADKPPHKRDVTLWEDKSARVWMPLEKAMEETFLYKLRKYKADRDIIEKSLGGAPLKVIFSVDVGGLNRKAAKQGVLVWQDPRQRELMEYLESVAPALSKEYGFPVSFLFVNSHPGEDAAIFYQEAVEEADWIASQNQRGAKAGAGKKPKPKHKRHR